MVADPHHSIFSFSKLGIPIGATLCFVENPEITCKVASENTDVKHGDQTMKLSTMSRHLSSKPGKETGFYSGLDNWTYEEETLKVRRDKLRDENSEKSSAKKKKIIYILTNPKMPGLVKIGHTINLKQRVRTLSSYTSVPVAFEVKLAGTIQEGKFNENKSGENFLHIAFQDKRVSQNREFFEMSYEQACELLETCIDERVYLDEKEIVHDAEDKQALDRAITKERKQIENFNFDIVKIREGTVLQFHEKDKNGEDIICTVVGRKKVKYKGKEQTLTSAARKVLTMIGKPNTNPRGPYYWHHNGESLVDIRERIESGNDDENDAD